MNPQAADRMPASYRPSVLLNVPSDPSFSNLFLAYISGLTCLGLRPRAALEIQGGKRRLNRIVDLIDICEYSIHDLSPVSAGGGLPRLNMSFELGLTVARKLTASEQHWFVFESQRSRLNTTLSDLAGTDGYFHGGEPVGVSRELGAAFERDNATVNDMQRIFDLLLRGLPRIENDSGINSPFSPRVFRQLCVLADSLSSEIDAAKRTRRSRKRSTKVAAS